MKLMIILTLMLLSSAFAQNTSVFDRNCESYAREKKFLHPKSVLDLDKNTERYYFYDNLTPAYGKMVAEVNKFAPGYYKTPNRAPVHACPGEALNSCLPFQAYCTETIAKAAVREDLAEWKVVATNCKNPKYRAKNPADHCKHDAIKQLQYVYDQTMILAREEAKKNPEAARFFKESALEFGKYRDDLKALYAAQKKIEDKNKEDARQKALTHQLAQAMKNCSDIVDEDGDDVQNRNIADKIASGLGCRDDLASLNQPQIKNLKDDIDNILKHIDTKIVLDQTNAIALEKTATAFWASKRQLTGAKLDSEASAISLICSEQPDLCENKLSRKTLSDSYKKSAAKLKSVTPLNDAQTARLLQAEFNPLVQEINSYCRQANTEYRRIRAETAEAEERNKPKVDPYREQYKVEIDNTRVVKHVNIEYVQAEMLLAAGRKSLQDKFSQLLDSKLGHLMMSKSLQEKVGIFNPANFHAHCAGGDGKMLKPATVADINGAKADFNELVNDELEKVAESHDAGALGRKKALKTYLKNNPLTIAELLKKNPSPEYANLMCYLIRDINSADQTKEYVKTGVTVVGVVASVALAATGVGAPAGAALFATVTLTTAVSAGASLDDYFAHKADARMSLQSGATNQSDKTASIDKARSDEVKADGSFKEFATTVVLEAAGFGIGKVVKVMAKPGVAGKLINSTDEVVETSNKLVVQADEVVEVTDDVVRAPAVASKPSILEGKKLEKVEVELDIPKVKVKTRPAQVESASAIERAKDPRYFEYLDAHEPKIGRQIITQTETYTERMAKMYGNNNPKDIAYRLEKGEIKLFAKGGEAKIYLNPANKDEALKVWHPSRKDDFDLSVRTVLHFEKRVEDNKDLAKVFTVARVKEIGPNYIVKDFYPNSLPIKKVTDAKQLEKLNAAIKEIKRQSLHVSDPIGQKLYKKILSKSENIHWDPKTEKVILIDALGF